MHLNNHQRDYVNVLQYISETLNVLEIMACKRCSLHEQGGMLDTIYHHQGDWQKALTPNVKISRKAVLRWINDKEHGLFHGFATLVAAVMASPTLLNPTNTIDICSEKVTKFDRLVTTILCHDIGRFIDADNHDGVLQTHFPGLLPIAFTHAHPTSNNALVQGDRLELLRYSDAKEWVQKDKLPPLTSTINKFYMSVRPALEYVWQNRHSTFIKHGTETDDPYDFKTGVFPNENDFAADIGPLLTHCLGTSHKNIIYIKRYGLITLDDLDGNLSYKDRDHPFVGGETDLNRWSFFHLHRRGMLQDVFVKQVLLNNLKLCSDAIAIRCVKTLSLLQSHIEAVLK